MLVEAGSNSQIRGDAEEKTEKRERLEVVHTVSALKYSFERRLVKVWIEYRE